MRYVQGTGTLSCDTEERLQYFSTITNEKGLSSQMFKCFSCSSAIGKFFSSVLHDSIPFVDIHFIKCYKSFMFRIRFWFSILNQVYRNCLCFWACSLTSVTFKFYFQVTRGRSLKCVYTIRGITVELASETTHTAFQAR